MEAAEQGDQALFVFRETGQVRMGNEIVGMLVVAGVAYEMPDVEKVTGGFEQAGVASVEFMQGTKALKQFEGEAGSDLGVGERDAVAFGKSFDDAALTLLEAGTAGYFAPGSEVGDNSFADAGTGIVQYGEIKALHGAEKNCDAGDDDLSAARADSG